MFKDFRLSGVCVQDLPDALEQLASSLHTLLLSNNQFTTLPAVRTREMRGAYTECLHT